MSNCLSIKAGPAAVIVSRNQPDKEDQLEPAQQYQLSSTSDTINHNFSSHLAVACVILSNVIFVPDFFYLEVLFSFESVCKHSTFVSIRVDTRDFYASIAILCFAIEIIRACAGNTEM
jgi:hypothetical protein